MASIFLFLLVIVGVGAVDGLWSWWFPVAVLLSAGPPGAFLGEWIIGRRISAQNVLDATTILPEAEISSDKKSNIKFCFTVITRASVE